MAGTDLKISDFIVGGDFDYGKFEGVFMSALASERTGDDVTGDPHSQADFVVQIASPVRSTGEMRMVFGFSMDDSNGIQYSGGKLNLNIPYDLNFFQGFSFQLGYSSSELEKVISRLESDWDSIIGFDGADTNNLNFQDFGELELRAVPETLTVGTLATYVAEKVSECATEIRGELFNIQDSLWMR